MTTTIHDLLDQLRSISQEELHKGKLFERLIAQYLKTDPAYANKLDEVWPWSRWPQRPADWRADNTGIDLVAKTKEGEFWAIQCKFYDDDSRLAKEHMASFLADSQKVFDVDGVQRTFAFRLLVSNKMQRMLANMPPGAAVPRPGRCQAGRRMQRNLVISRDPVPQLWHRAIGSVTARGRA